MSERIELLHENSGTCILVAYEEEYNPGQPGLVIDTPYYDGDGGALMDVADVEKVRDFPTAWLERVRA